MIVRRFLAWSQIVSPAQKAEGVRTLALAYLYSSMTDDMRAEAEAALTGMLDDPAPQVRLALAEAFASAVEAPRHCLIALANDQPSIATVVLGRSPILRDEDLIDCAMRGDAAVQCSVAARPSLSAAVSAALAAKGEVEALIALAENAGADVPDFSLRQMIDRFGADRDLREAMLMRQQLPACIKADLIDLAAKDLTAIAAEAGWLHKDRAERLYREVTEKATVAVTFEQGRDDPLDACVEMARRLRGTQRLTPSLMLRALLSGDRYLFIAALAELSGMPFARVGAFVNDHEGGAFSALYARALMPADLEPVFKAALTAQDETLESDRPADARLSRNLIARVQEACRSMGGAGSTEVRSLLDRLDVEAARQDAHAVTRRLIQRSVARLQSAPLALAGPA